MLVSENPTSPGRSSFSRSLMNSRALVLEDGLLDKFDGLQVFGFYLVHRAIMIGLQR